MPLLQNKKRKSEKCLLVFQKLAKPQFLGFLTFTK